MQKKTSKISTIVYNTSYGLAQGGSLPFLIDTEFNTRGIMFSVAYEVMIKETVSEHMKSACP